MEEAFLNTVIAFKLMSYSYSLACFFKDEFKKNENEYVIPFSHILYIKRNVFQLIRDSCDYVCPFANECDGHQFLNFIEKLYQFQQHAVLHYLLYQQHVGGCNSEPLAAADLIERLGEDVIIPDCNILLLPPFGH